MTRIIDLVDYLDQQFPACLAESWDNTGLLLGHRQAKVERVMTCLTVTPAVVDEAIRQNVSLLVSHHPLPFRPVSSLTDQSYYGGLIWNLASSGIAVYSPHTRFDSARQGINQQLAELLQLEEIQPLEPIDMTLPGAEEGLGRGRWGRCTDRSLSDLTVTLKEELKVSHLKLVPAGQILKSSDRVQAVALGCGSAGEFVRDAARLGCQLLVTGEATFHTCLEAQSLGVAMLLTGHYQSEWFAVHRLAKHLAVSFPKLEIWSSQADLPPVQFV